MPARDPRGLVPKQQSGLVAEPSAALTRGRCIKPSRKRCSTFTEMGVRAAGCGGVETNRHRLTDAMADSEPTLTSDPVASVGVCATATRESDSWSGACPVLRSCADWCSVARSSRTSRPGPRPPATAPDAPPYKASGPTEGLALRCASTARSQRLRPKLRAGGRVTSPPRRRQASLAPGMPLHRPGRQVRPRGGYPR